MSQQPKENHRGMSVEHTFESFKSMQTIPLDIEQCFEKLVQYVPEPEELKKLYIRYKERLGVRGTSNARQNMEISFEIAPGSQNVVVPVTPNIGRGGSTASRFATPPVSGLGISPGPLIPGVDNLQNSPTWNQGAPLFSPVSMVSCPEAALTPAPIEFQPNPETLSWNCSADDELSGILNPAPTSDYTPEIVQHPSMPFPLDSYYSNVLTRLPFESPTIRNPPTNKSSSASRPTRVSERRGRIQKMSKITKPAPSRDIGGSVSSRILGADNSRKVELQPPLSSPDQAAPYPPYQAQPSFTSSYRTPQHSPQQVQEPHPNQSQSMPESAIHGPRSTYASAHRRSLSLQEQYGRTMEFPPYYTAASPGNRQFRRD